jgi:signal transduction histidine kinase
MQTPLNLRPTVVPGHRASEFVKRLRGMSRPVRLIFLTIIVAVMVFGCIKLTQTMGQSTVIWLPNAFIAAALILTPKRNLPDLITAHLVGPLFGNLMAGSPFLIGLGFSAINVIESICVAVLYRSFVGNVPPFKNEAKYIAFIVVTCLPAALFVAWPGAALVNFNFGSDFWTTYVAWSAGSIISLIAFVPLFFWLMSPSHTSKRPTLTSVGWPFLGFVFLVAVLVGSTVIGQTVRGLMILIPFVGLFALRAGRVGTILVTAGLIPALVFTGAVDAYLVSSENPTGLGSEMLGFSLVFLGLAMPVNIIAIMVERLREAERQQRDISVMKSEFLSTMSHEIKTPLNAIHGMFQLFSRAKLPEKQDRWAKAGLSASENLQTLIAQMLDMAEIEQNRVRVSLRSVDPSGLAQTWATSIEAQIVANGQSLTSRSDIADDLPTQAQMDPEKVSQIVMNLASNAIKFSAKGEIVFTAITTGDKLQFSVHDQGIGIDSIDHPYVFGRFWQADQGSARRRDGAGLGLSIAFELAELMGGTMYFESAPGAGSTFFLELPIHPETL